MSLTQTFLRSPAVAALTSPHGVDRFLEVVNPMWAVNDVRAEIVDVTRETDDVVTLTLRPSAAWQGFRAGQNVLVGVEIAGARRTRCFSISSAEPANSAGPSNSAGPVTSTGSNTDTFTITVRSHEEGLVSRYLARTARPGLVLHLAQAEGTFTLPDPLPDRLLMISGGSGITPVMSMLRTLMRDGYEGDITFVHYSQSAEQTIFASELTALAGRDNLDLHVVHTRDGGERFSPGRLRLIAPDFAGTDTFACGPAGLVEQVQQSYDAAGAKDRLRVEYFKTSTIQPNPQDATGSIRFTGADRQTQNTGGTLLEQAEELGLQPEYGCRMGICFTCTSRKREGTVRNVVTGASSSLPDEDIQICVSTPVGDCAVDL